MAQRIYRTKLGIIDTITGKTHYNAVRVFIKLTDNRIGLDDKAKPIGFKLDTGASEVVVPAHLLDIDMSEEEYVEAFKPKCVNRHGIVTDISLKYYIHYIEKISLGDIVIRNFPILITFEHRTKSVLLGMSFLNLFNIFIDNENKIIAFQETKKTAELLEWDLPLYDVKDNVDVQLNSLDIEANYINKLRG